MFIKRSCHAMCKNSITTGVSIYGTMFGAMVGSYMFPGVGTILGGLIGGLSTCVSSSII